MKLKLTDRFLKNLDPPDSGRIEVSDEVRKGLRFRLSSSGQGAWVYEKRIKGGPKRKTTLGNWPTISLASARKSALELEIEATQGFDRVAERKAQSLLDEAAKAGLVSVEETLEDYDRLYLKPNLRTAKERKRQLERALADHLGKPISTLRRTDLQAAVDAKAEQGAPFAANRVRAALSAFVRWAWKRGYIETDIGSGLAHAISETPRERILSISEVGEILEASYALGELWGPFVRLLILTAQRRGDILDLTWDEVEFSQSRIALAGSRTKNGKPHITHLTEAALTELRSAQAFQTDNEIQSRFVFTTTGNTSLSGVGKIKARLDGLINSNRTEHSIGPIEPWRFHDIRTAFATEMAEAGEPENVVDRILNHVASGSAPSAVARAYNRAEQLPQRAKVLERWGNTVA